MNIHMMKKDHLTLTSTTGDFSIGRRRAIITLSLAPIFPFFYHPAEANPLLLGVAEAGIGFIARLFARSAGRRILSSVGSRAITGVGSRAITRAGLQAGARQAEDKVFKDGISKGVSIANSAHDVIDLADLLLDEKWTGEHDKGSTAVINNYNKNEMNTGNIVVNLQDKNTSNIDINATIEPITIPPLSRLVLDVDMNGDIPPGIKNLTGYYGDDKRYNFERSGNILIPKYGDNNKSIDQMLEEFENNGGQSYKPIS